MCNAQLLRNAVSDKKDNNDKSIWHEWQERHGNVINISVVLMYQGITCYIVTMTDL